MMKEISFIITALPELRKFRKCFPFSPMAEVASPIKIER